MMECELPRRPHTVGYLPKPSAQSDLIKQLIREIEEEANAPTSKPKKPQKNYMKENLKKLKEIQARAKQKSSEKQPLQPLKVPNKYSQIESKVSTLKSVPCKEKYVPPKTAGALRSYPPRSPCLSSKSDSHHNTMQQYRSLPDINSAVVPECDNDLRNHGNSSQSEKSAHSTACSKVMQKSESKPEVRRRLGLIPNYLTERKKEWELEKEKQIKLLELASIPPGHTLLPDEERLETLELLKKNQEELLNNLASLPVRNDTTRLRMYKEELERQLVKVEEGIKIFSKPKVLIKNDT